MNGEGSQPQLSAAQESPRKQRKTRRCDPSNRRVLPPRKCKITGPNPSITSSLSQHQTQLSTDRKTNREIFRWEELPAELRINIYTYVLTVPEPMHIWRLRHVLKRNTKFEPFTPLGVDLLLVNTYAEGAPILYGENDFRFQNPHDLEDFLISIRSRPLQWLKRVQLQVGDGHSLALHVVPVNMYNLLGEARKLEEFVLVEDSTSNCHHQKLARNLCSSRNAHTWLNKLVSAGGLSALARIIKLSTSTRYQAPLNPDFLGIFYYLETMYIQPDTNQALFQEALRALVTADSSNFTNKAPKVQLQLSDTDSEGSP